MFELLWAVHELYCGNFKTVTINILCLPSICRSLKLNEQIRRTEKGYCVELGYNTHTHVISYTWLDFICLKNENIFLFILNGFWRKKCENVLRSKIGIWILQKLKCSLFLL